MFSLIKKNFNSLNAFQLIFDLIIVFIGVYTAFFLSDLKAQKERVKDEKRMIRILNFGIEYYEELFAGFAIRHETVNKEFKEALENGEIPHFGGVTYPAPQYPIDVINNILTKESYEVFTVDVYLPLTQYASSIQRMMYVEEKLVEASEQYRPLPPKTSPDYKKAYQEQLQIALRYYRYLEIRKNTASELEKRSKALREQIAELAS